MARADTKLEHLSKVRLFSQLNKKELGRVAKASDETTATAGQVLTTEGNPGHEFFLIMDGEAKVSRDGTEVASLGPGGYFGELSLLDGGPRSATVTASTDMELLVLGQREFGGVLDEIPSVAHGLLSSMAARLREADARSFQY